MLQTHLSAQCNSESTDATTAQYPWEQQGWITTGPGTHNQKCRHTRLLRGEVQPTPSSSGHHPRDSTTDCPCRHKRHTHTLHKERRLIGYLRLRSAGFPSSDAVCHTLNLAQSTIQTVSTQRQLTCCMCTDTTRFCSSSPSL